MHRPEEGMNIKSEYMLVSAMVQLPHENETLFHQQAWEDGTAVNVLHKPEVN